MKNMKKRAIELLTKVIGAYATFIGVGGATLYYMKQIREVKGFGLIITLLFYMLGLFVLIGMLRWLKFEW